MNMPYSKVVLIVLLMVATTAHAQSVSTQIGARANGIGYASATLFDPWGIFNNMAGNAELKSSTVACAYDLRPSIPGANRMAATFSLPLKFGVIGTGAYRFGDDLYNEHLISAGYSSQFGIAALGASINYIQYRAEGFGSKGVFSLNMGGIAEITPQISVGAYIININQPEISEQEKLPTKLVAGVSFKPTDKVFIAMEIEKDLEYDPIWKMGFEYTFHEKFCARTGYNINPNTAFFGLGFKTKKFTIDYALQHNTSLNLSHQAAVTYQLKNP
jgi:hypothetical protein